MPNEVLIRINANASSAIAQLNGTALAAEKLAASGAGVSRNWSSAGRSLSTVGASMTRHLTIPIALAGGAAVKLAVDFDTSMNHIQALVGANAKQMDFYRKSILALAPAVGKGPKELADALYFITSSGFKGAAALDVLNVSAKAAAAGLGETQTVADLVTSVLNVYGHNAITATQATDALTAAVRLGKGEPADYATSLGRIIPVAQNLKIPFHDVAAGLASLTLGGYSAQKATTGMIGILRNLAHETTGGAAALKKVGLSYEGLQHDISAKGLMPTMLELNKAFHGNSQELRAVFTSGNALVPFLALTGKAAKTNVGIFNQLAHATGSTAKAFKSASENEAFKFHQALAKLQVAGIDLGEKMIPILVKVADQVGKMADAFDKLSPGVQSAVIAGALFLAVMGPITNAIGTSIKIVTGLASAYRFLVPAQEAAAASTTAVNAAMAGSGAAAADTAAGISGFTAEAAGAEGASVGLAGALGPAGIVGAGLLAIGVFIKVTHGLGGQSHAMENATASAQTYAQALQGLAPAHLSLNEATAAHVESIKAFHSAQSTVNQDLQKGLKGTTQYKNDLVAEQQAHFNVTGTLLAQRAAQGQLNDAQDKAAATQKRSAAGLEELSRDAQASARSVNNLNNRFGGFTQQAGGAALKLKLIADQANAFSGKTRTLAATQQALAKKLGGTGTAAGIAETKVAAMSLGASHLTDKLGHVPTIKQIQVYYKNNMATLISQAQQLGDAINRLQSKQLSITTSYITYHTNSGPSAGNARGTDFWRGGSTWVGEQGPEIVNLPRGSQVIPHKKSVAMASRGGGGEIHFHFPNALVVDGSTIRQAAKMIAPELKRMQARRA